MSGKRTAARVNGPFEAVLQEAASANSKAPASAFVSFVHKVGKAKRILIGRVAKPSLDGSFPDVPLMLFPAISVLHSHFRKSSFPDLPWIAGLFPEPVGKSPFDKPHGMIDACFALYCHEQMNAIRHDDKIMELKLALNHKGTQDIDEQQSIPFGLEKTAPGRRFCGGKKRVHARGDACRIGISYGRCHVRSS